tara:strand:+ start:18586 stop:20361 length:1776 start_codon:yes stop_codon:yes gene_type:complete
MTKTNKLRSVLMSLTLAACGSSGGDGGGTPDAGGGNADAAVTTADAAINAELTSLSISTQPVDTASGAAVTVSVEALDADGNLLSDATTVTLSIGADPGTGTLNGTQSVETVDGVATFDDISIDEAGAGYTLVAASGDVTAETNAFEIFVGAAASLVFIETPVGAESMGALGVSLAFVDQGGNIDTSVTDEVTLSFGTNPGEIVFHSSGNGTSMLESIDLATQTPLGWFESQARQEVRAFMTNEADGLKYLLGRNGAYFALDVDADTITELGVSSSRVRGLAFDALGNRFLAMDEGTSGLHEVDLVTQVTTELGTVTDATGAEGHTAFTVDPITGVFYAVAKTDGQTRRLVTIDPVLLTSTDVGVDFANDGVASLSFRADGTLLASTGDGGTPANTLYSVDKATGVMTELGLLPDALGDGEGISVIPARLHGNVTAVAVDGVVTFPDLRIDASALGYTLEATTANFPAATSAAFDVIGAQGFDGLPTLDAAAQTVSEGDGTATISVSIDAAQSHDVVLTYNVNSNSAELTNDRFFNIRIPAGATTGSRTITLVDDAVAEGSRTINFNLENVAMALEGGAIPSHVLTIEDND